MGRWPFIGRQRLVADTERLLAQGGVLLVGPAGVGKTAVARAVAQRTARRGGDVRWFFGNAASGSQPLGAFFSVLAADPPTREQRSMTAVTRTLDRLRATVDGRAPTLVVVDDVQQLDPLSMLVVQQLAHDHQPLILTARVRGAMPDVIAALWSDGLVERIDVPPLDELATGELVRAALHRLADGAIDPEVPRLVWRLTRGNLLHVRHLLDFATSGPIVRRGDAWRTDDGWTPGPGVVDLVERALAELDPDTLDAVDTVALAEPLTIDAAIAALGDIRPIEQAEAAGLLIVDETSGSTRLRVAHPLYGEVRRRRLRGARGLRLRGQLADVLRTRIADHDVLLVATLMLGSDRPRDPALLMSAVGAAFDRLDLPAAGRLADAALAAGAGTPARLARAYARSWLSDGEGAEHDAVIAAADATRAELWAATALRAGNSLFILSSVDGALAALDEAEGRLRGTEYAAGLDAFRSWLEAFRGDAPRALELSTRARAAGATAQAATFAALGASAALGSLGRVAELQDVSAAVYARRWRTIDAAMLRFALAEVEVWALRLAGLGVEAGILARRFDEEHRDVHGLFGTLTVSLLGYSAFASGRLGEAELLLRSANQALVEDRTAWSIGVTGHLAQTLAIRGDPAGARTQYRRMIAERHPAFGFREAETPITHARILAAEGRRREAVRVAIEVADRSHASGSVAYEVAALHLAVQFGYGGVAPRLEAARLVESTPRAGLAARQARALLDGDSEALAGISHEFEALGDLVEAVDSQAQAVAQLARAGDRAAADRATLRVESLAERAGGLSTPAMTSIGPMNPLTEREREVVRLAADGLTNRGIADRLMVSVRTVENHLYRAMTKLDIGDRSELAQIVR